MTNYCRLFDTHFEYNSIIKSHIDGRYISFCEDEKHVHYDDKRPRYSITSNGNWSLIKGTEPIISQENSYSVLPNTSLTIVNPLGTEFAGASELIVTTDQGIRTIGKITNLSGRYQITETDDCKLSYETVGEGFEIIKVYITIELVNINKNINIQVVYNV